MESNFNVEIDRAIYRIELNLTEELRKVHQSESDFQSRINMIEQ